MKLFAALSLLLLIQVVPSNATGCETVEATLSGNLSPGSPFTTLPIDPVPFNDLERLASLSASLDFGPETKASYRVAIFKLTPDGWMARLYADGATQPVSQTDAAHLIGEIPIRFSRAGEQEAPVELFALTPSSTDGKYALTRVVFKNMTIKDGSATLSIESKSKRVDSYDCVPSKPDVAHAVNGGVTNVMTEGIDNPPEGYKFDPASVLGEGGR